MTSRILEVVRGAQRAEILLGNNRRQLLEALHKPDSAAGLARRLGLPRQRVNYHLRLLEREGLVEPVEERRKGNCVERVVRATARTFVISPEALGRIGVPGRNLGDRASPASLIGAASQAIQDVAQLDAAAREAGKRLATLTLEAEVRFASAESRSAFMEALVTAVGRLVAEYHTDRAPRGRRFKLLALSHPVLRREDSDGE